MYSAQLRKINCTEIQAYGNQKKENYNYPTTFCSCYFYTFFPLSFTFLTPMI